MALNAMQIFMQLPKTNCGKCGFPTCLAFAMQLANQKVSLDACSDISDAGRGALEGASAPPIKKVKFGPAGAEVEMGDETEMFRHDKKFFHPTLLCQVIGDEDGDLEAKAASAKDYEFNRIGQIMKLDMVAVRASGDADKFKDAAEKVNSLAGKPMILMADDVGVMDGAARALAGAKPLLYRATADNWEGMAALAAELKLPLVVYAEELDALAELSEKVKGKGVDDIVLDFGPKKMGDALRNLTMLRRSAIKKKFRPFGFPVLLETGASDPGMMGSLGVMKYASIVTFDDVDVSTIYPIMTLRQNIYTDPQRPLQMEAKVYDINGPTSEKSPLMMTTNFSLTYFIVRGDIEKTKIPSKLLVIDTEGLSVMTAFAAEKLTAEGVAAFIKKIELETSVPQKKIIIPGQVARMSGTLEEESGWKVVVGPRDSSGLPKFMKDLAW